MNCKFCNKLTETFGKFCVCSKCKIVCFTGDITLEETSRLISEYLENIQNEVLKRQDFLHYIEQKYISKELLSSGEQEIRNNMEEFRLIHLELAAYIKNGSSLSEKTERNLLYRLLMLSEWLSKYLGLDA